MKPIKIVNTNALAIQAALDAVRGRATEHTHSGAVEIVAIADTAEKTVIALVGSKKTAIGAKVFDTSGLAVSNAYSRKAYARVATAIEIERRSTAWYLTDIVKTEIGQHGGNRRILLTGEQDALAVAKLRSGYLVRR